MRPETRISPTPGTLDEPNRLHGYAAKFGTPSEVLFDAEVCKGPFVEVIRPGAFTNSLRDHPDVRALYNHQAGAVLGRTKAGTLKIWEDEVGLGFDLTLPDTSVARDLRESLRRGDIDGCSFGFFVIRDEVVPGRKGEPATRYLDEIHVYEITPATTFPAYLATEVNLRSIRIERPAAPTPRPCLALATARLRLERSGLA
jgi:HK97 family phage prohead protease